MSRLTAAGSTGVRKFFSFVEDNLDVSGVTLDECWYIREGGTPQRFTASASFQEHVLQDGVPATLGSLYSVLVPDAALISEAGVGEVAVVIYGDNAGNPIQARLAIDLPRLAAVDSAGRVQTTSDDTRDKIRGMAILASPAPTASSFSVDDSGTLLSVAANAYHHAGIVFSSGLKAVVTGYSIGAGNVRNFVVKQVNNDTGAFEDLPVAIDSSWTFDLEIQ